MVGAALAATLMESHLEAIDNGVIQRVAAHRPSCPGGRSLAAQADRPIPGLALSALAWIPLAALIGEATEGPAARTGRVVGCCGRR